MNNIEKSGIICINENRQYLKQSYRSADKQPTLPQGEINHKILIWVIH